MAEPLAGLQGLDLLSVEVELKQDRLQLSMKELDLVAAHNSKDGFRTLRELAADSGLVIAIELADCCAHLRFLSEDVVQHVAYAITHIAFIVLPLLGQLGLLDDVVVASGEEILDVLVGVGH